MVVDLSVDAEDEFPVGADQRLPSGGGIYDGKAFMGPVRGDGFVYSLITLVYAGLALRRVY